MVRGSTCARGATRPTSCLSKGAPLQPGAGSAGPATVLQLLKTLVLFDVLPATPNATGRYARYISRVSAPETKQKAEGRRQRSEVRRFRDVTLLLSCYVH